MVHLHTVFEGTQLVGCPKHHGEVTTDLPLLTYLDFRDFLFLFTLMMVLNDIGSMTGVIVLLKNNFWGQSYTSLVVLHDG